MGNKFSSSNVDAVERTEPDGTNKSDSPREKLPTLSSNQREIVIECFLKSREDTTQRIIMRMMQQRDEFRNFTECLDTELRSNFALLLKNYLQKVIENIDNADKVKSISSEFGAFHVLLKWCGFRPDFFAAMANAIATECAFLSDTSTGSTATFRAWTLLVGFMFSAVRDGYYKELRHRRRSPHLTNSSRSTSDLKSMNEQNSISMCSSSFNLTFDNALREKESNEVRNDNEKSLSRSPSSGGSPSESKSNVRQGRTLRRGAAFYIRDWPEKYKVRSRSAYALKSNSMDLDKPEMQKLKIAAFSHYKEMFLINSASSTSSGRYQKNVTLSDEQKKRFARKQATSQEKSASSSSLFDPNKIIDDFMHDRL